MKFSQPIPRFIGLLAVTALAGFAGAAAAFLIFSPAPGAETLTAVRAPVPARNRVSGAAPRTPVVTVALVSKKSFKPLPGGKLVADRDLTLSATVLTSDGWLVTDREAYLALADPLALLPGGRAVKVLTAAPDTESGLIFLRVEAKDLEVVAFGRSAELLGGEELFLAAPDRAFRPLGLLTAHGRARAEVKDAIRESDSLGERLILGEELPERVRGAGLLTSSGQLVGVFGGSPKGSPGSATAVPVEAIYAALKEVAKSGELHRPSLGLSAVDLSELADRNPELLRAFGALVAAVKPGGPAALAGLKVGDRITALGREALDGSRLLSDLLSSYRIGEKVELTVIRDGQEKKIELIVADSAGGK